MKRTSDERRALSRASRKHKKPEQVDSTPEATTLGPSPFAKLVRWLLSIIVAGAIAVFGVWFQANYVPRLEVVHVDGVKLPIRQIETTLHGSVRFDLFEALPEFKNHGLRAGSLKECKVEPWRNYLSPTVEVTHIDLRAIPRGAMEVRLVQFRSQSPADPAQRSDTLTWSIGCWDETGNSTGKLYTVFHPEGKKH